MSPSIIEEQKLLSFMDTGGKLLISWGTTTTDVFQCDHGVLFTWHISSQQGVKAPRHVFVSYQARERLNNQERNPMVFDTLGVSEVSLKINGHQEPSEDILIDFEYYRVARTYHRLMSFIGCDLNVDAGLQISQRDFVSLYPIYYFSLEHLDLAKQSVVDLHFRARVGVAPAGGFRAIAVILSDKAMLLEGTGGQMRIIHAPVENML